MLPPLEQFDRLLPIALPQPLLDRIQAPLRPANLAQVLDQVIPI